MLFWFAVEGACWRGGAGEWVRLIWGGLTGRDTDPLLVRQMLRHIVFLSLPSSLSAIRLVIEQHVCFGSRGSRRVPRRRK